MAAVRYRHIREGTGKGSENGVRQKGTTYPVYREVCRSGTSVLGEKERTARHGPSTQVSDGKKWNRHVQLDRSDWESRYHGTRQAAGGHGLSVQYARTDPRKYSFAVRTVEKWNSPPDDVKSVPNGEVFRSRIAKL
jgi:hypothetical protein